MKSKYVYKIVPYKHSMTKSGLIEKAQAIIDEQGLDGWDFDRDMFGGMGLVFRKLRET